MGLKKESASRAEKILGLEEELLAKEARETQGVDDTWVAGEAAALQAEKGVARMTDQDDNKNKNIRQAHDKYVEACSWLLDQLRVGVGAVAVDNRSAWESVSNMSKIMSTLSDLQLYLLSKNKSLSLSNEGVLTNHHNKMKVVMLDFQRVVYTRRTPTVPSIQYAYVKKRTERGDKEIRGERSHDCVEWMERLFDKGAWVIMELSFMKETRGAGNLKVVEAGDGGVGVANNDANSEFPTRLHGLKNGLFVPWVTEPGERNAATADDKSSGVDEPKPSNLKRQVNVPKVREEQNVTQQVEAEVKSPSKPRGKTQRDNIRTRSASKNEKTK